ncbi:DUF4405 domain-containing protein [uncultured Treponema sp.]|uniref:DUF4405 domain-containing protein n=1 Tax=uncultured Treponema sp. TaxID=162155 RepID=UPI0025E5024A|nr:DUF4405 domain-containing protein [uncultured Treponema sp.]
MIKTQKLRIPLDITMTALSVILMGGTVLFSNDKVHQILGMALLALWAVHIALNRKWYGAVLKGKYNPYRIMQTVVNFGILLCAILLAVSGMMMAWFVPETVSVPLGFARTAHLVSSHWYYIFMCAHLGMHVGMIANKIRLSRTQQKCSSSVQQKCHSRAPTRESSGKEIIGSSPIMTDTPNKAKAIAAKVLLALVCVYGIYAFIVRGVGKYMFLRQQFFFLDLEKGYLIFALDYLSILVLIATASYWLGKALRAWNSGHKE